MPRDPTNTERSDAELVAALNRGDASAFDALYYRHRDFVARTARRFAGNDEDALDALQETFAYLFGKFPGFVLTAKLTTFLYPVVKHLSLAAKQKRMRIGSGAAVPERATIDPPPGDARDELSSVLGRLPEPQREVLLLRFVDDFSLAEIAAALAVPLGTVKSRLHTAVASLQADPALRKYFEID